MNLNVCGHMRDQLNQPGDPFSQNQDFNNLSHGCQLQGSSFELTNSRVFELQQILFLCSTQGLLGIRTEDIEQSGSLNLGKVALQTHGCCPLTERKLPGKHNIQSSRLIDHLAVELECDLVKGRDGTDPIVRFVRHATMLEILLKKELTII